ncbi:hypothetical protein HDU67_003028 [Dinochytrium kinnereticum]|nr:hypothetical protein HDU67_003028 [Dinochytrium kinnereticum]
MPSDGQNHDDMFWAVKVPGSSNSNNFRSKSQQGSGDTNKQPDQDEDLLDRERSRSLSTSQNPPTQRNDSISHVTRRVSVSRRSSVLLRSRPNSGGLSSNPFRHAVRQVSRERVQELWRIIKSTFLHKTPDIVNLLNNSAPIPYTLSIRQGFQFKYKLNVKHHIKCVAMHPRIPWHHAEGRVDKVGRKKNEAEVESDDDKQMEDDERLDSKVHKVIPYTFVCIDHSRTVRIWDVARSATVKPRSVVKLSTDIFQCVFLARYSMYAGCSDDKALKV